MTATLGVPSVSIGFTYHRPSLLGEMEDGELLDLDGGVITFRPVQEVRPYFGVYKVTISETLPRIYHLSFTKSLVKERMWTDWFALNPDVVFWVCGIRFRLVSMQTKGRRVTYVADGWEGTR